jgi:pimeloyl-ACP methyl ester carboxylesterase
MGALNLRCYVLFMQDYGGPVGFRLELAHPERVQALIIQNAVASARCRKRAVPFARRDYRPDQAVSLQIGAA